MRPISTLGYGSQTQVQYPGAVDLVMNRGARPEPIFYDDQDRGRFLR